MMVVRHLSVTVAVCLLATAAAGQVTLVGKKMSVASTASALAAVPAYPATLAIASVGVPSAYKSKKNILAISTSVQEICTGDTVGSLVQVGGFNAQPDPNASYWFECYNNSGYEMRARDWFLVPESAGGPVVPPAATIDLLLTSTNGTAQAAVAVIQAQLSK